MEKLTAARLQALNDEHVRNLARMEQSNADVLVHSTDIPGGYVVPLHRHRRAQFLCVFSGVVLVATDRGRWMIPPGHALVIPQGLEHSVEMCSDVSMRSVYIHAPTGQAASPEPAVLEVTELARQLIATAVQQGRVPDDRGRADLVMALLLDEIGRLPERRLGLPFPASGRLAGLCRDFVDHPSPTAKIDDWARQLHMSRRTFTRFFRQEMGVSFVTWRQQACLFACLPRLAAGEPVTRVALDAGYESVPAFTTMFRRMLGTSPRAYLSSRAAA
ncbi:AraC family transcriptional regulator [Shinella fusca]|jgi:AraC-like DNA-binding protein/quercetin dioxygenase-like cupin family protein|uniref:AraC-like DNA-binding protein/quercetin dioxygenase-like cupin family protein n=1 Tax=Shinella fusca TaxID=544480 RepID=A0A7W7YW53_9HYPH|nr:helix-turn-helix transcriptional regulator [Shinella fusca]MBB5043494.1 AraC-like DNA-binding protein/quercetin dioxygenase-like cupin family protein [Shinella fusca]